MIILLGVLAWIAILSFVAMLCLAARRGDQADELASAAAGAEQAPQLIVVTRHRRAVAGRGAEPTGRLVEAGGAAG
jgi:predicted lipid-binding transport protein (Tim44 family)